MTGGDENVLKAIDFDALEADPDYNIYDTLLIPSTFNSILGDLGIYNHLGEGECFTNIVNLNFVGYDQTPFYIGSQAFRGCANFTSVDASKRTITFIGSQAFFGCVYLDTVSLKTTVVGVTISIGSQTFFGCENLQTFSIPDATTANPQNFSIDSYAFSGCVKLTGFDAPTNSITITSIGSDAFLGCASLTVDGLNAIELIKGTNKIITNGNVGIAFKPDDNSPLYTKGCLIAGVIDLTEND
jgi:hypothetical protein